MAGDLRRARADVEQGERLTRDLGLSGYADHAALFAGNVELIAGDAVAAEADLRRARQGFAEMTDKWMSLYTTLDLASALADQGRHAEALPLVDELNIVQMRDDRPAQIKWRAIRSRIAAHAGQSAEAIRLAEEAIAIAQQTDLLNEHAKASSALAEALELARRPDDARAAAENAIRLYEQKGNVTLTDRTRERLSQIRAEARHPCSGRRDRAAPRPCALAAWPYGMGWRCL